MSSCQVRSMPYIATDDRYVSREEALEGGLAFWTNDGIPGIQVSSHVFFPLSSSLFSQLFPFLISPSLVERRQREVERADDQAEHWSPLPTGQNRDSVRITSHALYSGGLFLIDLALMPWGCGVWPACKSSRGWRSEREKMETSVMKR
jgi:hypothetical protein